MGWTKSGAILTEKINGKFWMYYLADAAGRGSQRGVAYSEDLHCIGPKRLTILFCPAAQDRSILRWWNLVRPR